MRRAPLVIFLSLLAFAGCGPQHPPPLAVSEFTLSRGYFSGTPLTGPTSRPVNLSQSPEDQPTVAVGFVALRQMPAGAGQSLTGAMATLVTSVQDRNPLLAAPRLTAGGRFVPIPPTQALAVVLQLKQKEDAREVGGDMGVLLPDVVNFYTLTAPQDLYWSVYLMPLPQQKQVAIALQVQGEAQPLPSFEAGELPPQAAPPPAPGRRAPTLTREMILLHQPWPDQPSHFALILPMKLSDNRNDPQAMAIDILLLPGQDDATHAQLVAAARQSVEASISQVARQPRTVGLSFSNDTAINAALANLSDPARRRPALAFVANQVNAPLTELTILSADDKNLADLASKIQTALENIPPNGTQAPEPAVIAWAMDRATFQWLARLKLGKHLPPELVTVLETYAGEAGRQDQSLEMLLKQMDTRANFETHLTSENLVFLDEPSPGMRVRAYDWLLRRGSAPAGYHPLAPATQRDAALNALYGGSSTDGSGAAP